MTQNSDVVVPTNQSAAWAQISVAPQILHKHRLTHTEPAPLRYWIYLENTLGCLPEHETGLMTPHKPDSSC